MPNGCFDGMNLFVDAYYASYPSLSQIGNRNLDPENCIHTSLLDPYYVIFVFHSSNFSLPSAKNSFLSTWETVLNGTEIVVYISDISLSKQMIRIISSFGTF
eukprot:553073_1